MNIKVLPQFGEHMLNFGFERFQRINSQVLAGEIIRDCMVATANGPVQAVAGDFVALDVAGLPYPIKPEIFHRTYRSVGL